jgi:general secretion pathway protein H
MRTSLFRTNSGENGFSLVEMLIATAILSLAALSIGAALPRMLQRQGAAEFEAKLVHFLREARWHAQMRQATTRVTIQEGWISAEPSVPSGRLAVPRDVDVAITAAEELSRPFPTIAFLRDGTSSGGRIALGSGGTQRIVEIGWASGRAVVHE